MSKSFRPWLVDQPQFLPPSVMEFVPEGHVAHFVRNLVRDELDLSAILAVYGEERGYPPYHPVMMTALLLYGYSRGVYSSRRLERACEERLDFLAVTAMNRPDHRTICAFRRRHLAALSDLFVQVLKLCQAAGLVELGHVALDGTKIAANASKHKAMSYGRMKKAEAELKAEVDAWLAAAEAADAEEDARFGAARGDITLNARELTRHRQRSHLGFRIERVADLDARDRAKKQIEKFLLAPLRHKNARE